MSVVDWLQSFQGITTLSIGGISLSGIIGFILYAVKSGSQMKGVSDLVTIVKDAKVMIDEEREKNAALKEEKTAYEIELTKRADIENLLLKSVSVIVAASSGIDPMSKIELLNDMKTLQNNLIDTGKAVAIETKEEVKKDVKEQTIKLLDSAIVQTATLIDKYSKK